VIDGNLLGVLGFLDLGKSKLGKGSDWTQESEGQFLNGTS
jgi:hypothetical protein